MKEYLRRKLIHWLTKDLFNAITADDLLRIKLGNMYLRNKKMTDEQISELKTDAEKFANSVIWKILYEDAVYQANFMMYEYSKDYGGMMFGKAMLYALDVLNKKIQQLSKLK